MKLLLWSTPIGFLGSGAGGGVELTLINVAQGLMQRDHEITVLAPVGSAIGVQRLLNPAIAAAQDIQVLEVAGVAPASAQHQDRNSPVVIPAHSVLGSMGQKVLQMQGAFDAILNFAYDWLPLYLTPFLATPLAHVISMGSLSEVMDEAIAPVMDRFPQRIGVHSKAQAATFAGGDRCRCLGNGLDLSRYHFNPHPQPCLGWVGRITPEKGLEDAFAAVAQCQIPLKVWGALENPDYWQRLQAQYPQAPVTYGGFLPTTELQAQLGQCQGLLMTPRWLEAFGNVAMEALACGVPVIAYDRGGPSEIVRSGTTGWLVEPDSVAGLVAAVEHLPDLDRWACRQQAEAEYSLAALGDRYEQWLQAILADT